MRTRISIPTVIILIFTLCPAVTISRASELGSVSAVRFPSKRIRPEFAPTETRTVSIRGDSAAETLRPDASGVTNNSAVQLVSTLLWSRNALTDLRTRLPFLALISVNATTGPTFDSTEGAEITLVLKFSDISQGAVVANPVSNHTPPNACQGATLQHGLQVDITPIPGAIIIPPQPNPPLADPAIISSTWMDCQGRVIEQWHCYIFNTASPPRGKFRYKGCNNFGDHIHGCAVIGVRG